MPKKENETKKEDVKFTKEQILKSKKFKNRVDLIRVILQDNESYTLEEVQKEIDKFMKRRDYDW